MSYIQHIYIYDTYNFHVIHKNLNDIVNQLINNKSQDFDIILLGYLLNYKLSSSDNSKKNYINDKYDLHSYNDELWGAQMYLISRTYAKYLIENFDFLFIKLFLIHFKYLFKNNY